MIELEQELRGLLSTRLQVLPDKPEENVDSTLRALWSCAAGRPVSAKGAASVAMQRLTEPQIVELRALIERRLGGVPLAHLTGRQRFMDLEMLASAAALVPREETELLASAAIAVAQRVANTRAPLIVDACCGSGNVALAIASAVPTARVLAVDLSEDAVNLARANALHLGLQRSVEFKVGDLLEPVDLPDLLGAVDLLTCNPPYISTAKVGQMQGEISEHEPRVAFDGGALGVSVLMRLLEQAPRFLRPSGTLLFEVGKGQGPAMLRRIQTDPRFGAAAGHEDRDGLLRVVSGTRA